MFNKQLPKTDAERVKALQTALILASSADSGNWNLPKDVAKYIHPFLVKLQHSIQISSSINGTQAVDQHTLRMLIDELLLDIWEEIECAVDEVDPFTMEEKAIELGINYTYVSQEKESSIFRLVA
ncbi:MAG: hypothetical protein K1X82_10630 [Bacteroidia bacterium]|nr:hypothetical protein [Bacteroidia bacterium]